MRTVEPDSTAIEEMAANSDLTSAELREEWARKTLEIRPDRDGRVCICGHAMNYHTGMDEEERAVLVASGREATPPRCHPGKQDCPCVYPVSVLMTRDTRKFMKKTMGADRLQHSLTRAIMNDSLQQIVWLREDCVGCGTKTHDAYGLTSFDINKAQIVNGPAKLNALLCRDCLLLVRSN